MARSTAESRFKEPLSPLCSLVNLIPMSPTERTVIGVLHRIDDSGDKPAQLIGTHHLQHPVEQLGVNMASTERPSLRETETPAA